MLAGSACCANISVTITPSATTVKTGDRVDTAITATNSLAKRAPITLQATASWTDPYGVTGTSSASATLNVTQPVVLTNLTIPVSSNLVYISGSAKVDGVAVTPTVTTTAVTVPIGRTLLETESSKIDLAFTAK